MESGCQTWHGFDSTYYSLFSSYAIKVTHELSPLSWSESGKGSLSITTTMMFGPTDGSDGHRSSTSTSASCGHRRVSSQGNNSSWHHDTRTKASVHHPRSPGGRRHRRASSYDTHSRCTHAQFTGLTVSDPTLMTPPLVGNRTRQEHRRGGSSNSNFDNDTSFKGITDQFKQYQRETVHRTRIHKERKDPEHHSDACDDFCTYYCIPCCCVACWLCCSDCGRDSEASGLLPGGEQHSDDHTPRAMTYKTIDPIHRVILQGHGGSAVGNHWLGVVPSVFYSILLLIAFLSLSSTTKFIDESHRTWALHQGETRQVPVPVIFNKHIEISMRSNDGGGVDVFSFEGVCPPLTGPPVNLQFGPSTRHLEEGNYQYEYFWMNEGSTIRVDITQLHGSSSVYILMGDQLLERLINENHDYAYDGGFKSSLVKKSVTAPNEDGQTSATLEYTSLESNTYILLYENACNDESIGSAWKSSDESVVTVQYSISLTSHNVQPYSQICKIDSHTDAADDMNVKICVVSHASVVAREGCLLVQATNAQTDDTPSVSTVYVSECRRWMPLILCSLIPIFLVYSIRAVSRWYHRRMNSWYHADSTEAQPRYRMLPPIPLPTDQSALFAPASAEESDELLPISSSSVGDYRSVLFDGNPRYP